MTAIPARAPTKALFTDATATPGDPGQWVVRGGNFAVAYTKAASGAVLPHQDEDEYILVLPGAGATVEWNGQQVDVVARSLTIVPPGTSVVTVPDGGEIVRIFTARGPIAATADNAAIYADGAPELAPATPWPQPVGGWSIKSYPLDDYRDHKFRLFRSPNLMVNIFDLIGPRDTAALTPHSHTDFEQGSLALAGEWMHSLRYPWTANLADWREDEHWAVGSPSLLVIPATVIHTSRAVSAGQSQLVDIFCPPRRDFSDMGLVCNADDFPLPA